MGLNTECQISFRGFVMGMVGILNGFPKKRLELPEDYKIIYEKYYIENRNGKTKMSGASQFMERWLHRKIAKTSSTERRTLEIGAGTLNQLKYEAGALYDVVEPFELLYRDSPEYHRVKNFFKDISEISSGEKYDRITSCACFEHILNLPEVIAKTCMLLNNGGILCTSIPNEGRFLWTLGWKVTTGGEFRRRYGLDYGVIMRYEHVNTADEIETILKYFYKKVRMKIFGINKTLALYRYYESSMPELEKAKEYISKVKDIEMAQKRHITKLQKK